MRNWVSVIVGLLAVQLAALGAQLIDDVTLAREDGFRLDGLEHPYNRINEQLCQSLKTDDYEANARLLLSRDDKKVTSSIFYISPRARLHSMALELITAAERGRADGSWCQGERITDLARLNKHEVKRHVAALRRKQPRGMLACNRVFGVFFEQTLAHLEQCARVYEANLRRVVDELNEFRLRDGDRALGPLIGGLEKRLQAGGFELVQALRGRLLDSQLDQHLIGLASDLTKQFLRARNPELMEPHELERLVFDMLNKYLHQPCVYLTSNLRATLGPATLDLENLDEFWQGGEQLPEVARQMRAYGPDVHKFWAQYLVCNKLLELDYVQLGQALKRKVFETSE